MCESPVRDANFARFNALMKELLEGGEHRGAFRPWEIEILLNIDSCEYCSVRMLLEYQRAVQREFRRGANFPLKLTEYLERRKRRREQRKSTKASMASPAGNFQLNIV